jgi:hypothetical protein
LRDEREQAMFVLISLAGSGWQVTDRNGDVELVGQRLSSFFLVSTEIAGSFAPAIASPSC